MYSISLSSCLFATVPITVCVTHAVAAFRATLSVPVKASGVPVVGQLNCRCYVLTANPMDGVQEIDWMALQGINTPLAFTGAEWVWRKVYQKFGLHKAELDK